MASQLAMTATAQTRKNLPGHATPAHCGHLFSKEPDYPCSQACAYREVVAAC